MEKLRDLRKQINKPMREVANDLNISVSALAGYETGTREPSLSVLTSLADYYGVTVDALLRDEKRVPVVGDVKAGIPAEAIEDLDPDEWEEVDGNCKEYFALRITGTSMQPRMSEGDVVIVKKQNMVENGDIAVVLVGDEATCKKIKFTKSGLYLIGLNPDFEPLFYSPEECVSLPVRILGKVVELRAKF